MKNTVFFLILSMVLAVTNVLSGQDFKEVDKTFKLDKTGKVILETYKGDVTIETWDRPEVHIYARIVPDDQFWGTRASKQLHNAEVIFDNSPSTLKIKSKYHENHSFFGNNTQAFVNYKIQMPKTAELKVEDYKSEIKISGLQSFLKLVTYKGEVRINELAGSLNLETYKGEVEVAFSLLKNDSRLETNKGKITVTLPAKAAFNLYADFGKHVDFTSDFSVNRNDHGKKHSGYKLQDKINGGGPELNISSEKGDIRLRAK